MAIMIPTDGGYFDPASREKEMFDALEKGLSNDFFVFHSFRVVNLIPDKGLNENEIDFLVFNPNYGCLFLECKNRTIDKDERGNWIYYKNVNGERKPTQMQDPFDQAFSGQHNLFNKLRDTYPVYRDMINKCKFMVAIWLPMYTKKQIEEASFAANVETELIMTKEALHDSVELNNQITNLMERMNRVHLVCKYEEVKIIDNGGGYKNSLSRNEAMELYKNVLCPTFKTVVNVNKEYEDTYIRLLEEQCVVLDFLANQRTAAISGASGTGKTLVALQRAEDISRNGDRVLFLCYNWNLKVYLETANKKRLPNVDFYTLDGFGCEKCHKQLEEFSYYDLADVLLYEMENHKFPYKHIIVDEGQDFGKRNDADVEIRSYILELFANYGNGIYEDEDTSFFVFYDKNQRVNSTTVPKYITEADSKLTLYRNCRNTRSIASTAYSLLETKPMLNDRAWKGDKVDFIFYSDKEELIKRLDKTIQRYSEGDNSDRVIISCSESLLNSSISGSLEQCSDERNYVYKSNEKKTRAYTSSTFKGLEADDVIIIDLTAKTFEEDDCDFYVAASRAKKRMTVFVDVNKVEVRSVLESRFGGVNPSMDLLKQLAIKMNGVPR